MEGYRIIPYTGPPSAPTGVSVASCSVDSVTLVWEDTSSVPTSYVLSATPTVENCEPNCTTPTRQFTFTGLQLEQTYMFDVSGINCGNQIGNAASYSVKYSGMCTLHVCICTCNVQCIIPYLPFFVSL